jgi:serine/threonine protein kinase
MIKETNFDHAKIRSDFLYKKYGKKLITIMKKRRDIHLGFKKAFTDSMQGAYESKTQDIYVFCITREIFTFLSGSPSCCKFIPESQNKYRYSQDKTDLSSVSSDNSVTFPFPLFLKRNGKDKHKELKVYFLNKEIGQGTFKKVYKTILFTFSLGISPSTVNYSFKATAKPVDENKDILRVLRDEISNAQRIFRKIEKPTKMLKWEKICDQCKLLILEQDLAQGDLSSLSHTKKIPENHFFNSKNIPFDYNMRIEVLKDVIADLQKLHDKRFQYGDLNPHNILVTYDPRTGKCSGHLGDFSWTREAIKLAEKPEPPRDYWDSIGNSFAVTHYTDIYGLVMTIGSTFLGSRFSRYIEDRQETLNIHLYTLRNEIICNYLKQFEKEYHNWFGELTIAPSNNKDFPEKVISALESKNKGLAEKIKFHMQIIELVAITIRWDSDSVSTFNAQKNRILRLKDVENRNSKQTDAQNEVKYFFDIIEPFLNASIYPGNLKRVLSVLESFPTAKKPPPDDEKKVEAK